MRDLLLKHNFSSIRYIFDSVEEYMQKFPDNESWIADEKPCCLIVERVVKSKEGDVFACSSPTNGDWYVLVPLTSLEGKQDAYFSLFIDEKCPYAHFENLFFSVNIDTGKYSVYELKEIHPE